eukprot:5194244-Prymnesium_polylepis.1
MAELRAINDGLRMKVRHIREVLRAILGRRGATLGRCCAINDGLRMAARAPHARTHASGRAERGAHDETYP